MPVVMMSGHGTVETAVEATRLGAVDYVEKPLSLAKLLRTVQRALDEGKRRVRATRTLVTAADRAGWAQPSHARPARAGQADRSARSAVLVLGEPGTGREAFARYIHAMSERSTGRLSASLQARLLRTNAEESLFGVEANGTSSAARSNRRRAACCSSTGSRTRADRAAAAARGARVGLVRAQGRTHARRARCAHRVVRTAWLRDPRRRALRVDLLSNLNVLSLRIPPLREYAEDVPELLRYYVDRLVDDERLPFRRFGVAAQNRLRNYPWPGNIRELKNLVTSAADPGRRRGNPPRGNRA
jgi:DNA-binding NtrC family response regulator